MDEHLNGILNALTFPIYTDGACIGNPGPGGWGAIIVEDGVKRTLSGGEAHTTNNRMEMMAAIQGLEAVPEGAQVLLTSDSQYLINTMTKNWKRNVNRDLWDRLDKLAQARGIRWAWVRGHNGHPENEEVDKLAVREAAARRKGR